MNRIYKVVWCHVRNTYVVASELASRKKLKSVSTGTATPKSVKEANLMPKLVVTGLFVSLMSIMPTAYTASISQWGGNAAYSDGNMQGTTNNSAQAISASSIAIGRGSVAGGVSTGNRDEVGYEIAIGASSHAQKQGAIAFGSRAKATEFNAIAFGYNSSVTGFGSIAFGGNASASSHRSVVLGESAKATHGRSILIGAEARSVADMSTVLGYKSQALSAGANTFGAESMVAIDAIDSMAIGTRAKVNEKSSSAIAMGTDAEVVAGSDYAIAIGRKTSASKYGAVSLGVESIADGRLATAVGAGSKALVEGGVALGWDATVAATATHSIAIGKHSNVTDVNSVVIGQEAKSTGNTSVVMGYKAAANSYNTVVIGGEAVANGYGGTAVGRGATAGQGFSTAFGNDAKALGSTSISIGPNSTAEGTLSTAIGNQSISKGTTSQAVGYKSQALQNNAVSLGNSAISGGGAATALGSFATSLANGATALGTGSKVEAEANNGNAFGTEALVSKAATNSTAIGTKAIVSEGSQNSIAFGSEAKIGANVNNAIAIGSKAEAAAQQSVAMGNLSKAIGDYSTALGTNANSEGVQTTAVGSLSKAIGDYSTALGTNANANGVQAAALGNLSKAIGDYSTALGTNAQAEGLSAVALGASSKANVQNSVAIGANSVATVANTVSFGSDTIKRKLVNVANGEVSATSYEAVNGSQLWAVEQKIQGLAVEGNQLVVLDSKKTKVTLNPTLVDPNDYNMQNINIELGSGAKVTGTNSIVMGNRAEGLGGNAIVLGDGAIAGVDEQKDADGNVVVRAASKSIAIGSQSIATGNSSVALGESSKSTGSNSIALGSHSESIGFQTIALGSSAIASGDNGVAIGHKTEASGSHSFAFGVDSKAQGTDSTAIGNGSIAKGTNSVAMGSLAEASGNNSFALGSSAKANTSNSVAIGASSETYGNNEISFGFHDNTGMYARKLTHVAKGEVSNTSVEAINGSQLHAAKTEVANILGEGAIVDQDGKLTGPTFLVNQVEREVPALDENGQPVLNDDGTPKVELVKGFDTIKGAIENLGEHDQKLVESLGGSATINQDGSITGPTYKFTDNSTHTNVGSALTNLDNRVDGNSTNITNILEGKAGLVQIKGVKDDVGNDIQIFGLDNEKGKNIATFDFANEGAARKLTGVAEGEVSSTSVDAINGSQLHTTNQQVAGNTTNIKNLGDRVSVNEDSIINIEEGLTSINENLHYIDGRVTTNQGEIYKLQDGLKDITDRNANSLTGIEEALGGGASFNPDGSLEMPNYQDALSANKELNSVEEGFRYIDGELQDQGKQITNIDNRVTQNSGDITNIKGNVTNILEGKAGLVQIKESKDAEGNDVKTFVLDNDKGKNIATFDFANDGSARTLTGISDGKLAADSTDAVNGSQLFKTNEDVSKLDVRVTKNEGDIKNIQGDISNITSGTAGLVQLGVGAQASQIILSDKANDRDAFNFAGGPVSADRPNGERTLTGVAKGEISSTSTEAINGSQLYQSQDDFAKLLTVNAGYDKDGKWIKPDFSEALGAQGGSVLTVEDGFKQVSDRVNTNKLGIEDNKAKLDLAKDGLAVALGGDATFNANGQLEGVNFQDALGADTEIKTVYDGFKQVNKQIAESSKHLIKVSDDGLSVVLDQSQLDYKTTSIALGNNAKVNNINQGQATALGNRAEAMGASATAVGNGATAKGAESSAFGFGASAGAYRSVALGPLSKARSSYSVAIGSGSTTRTQTMIKVADNKYITETEYQAIIDSPDRQSELMEIVKYHKANGVDIVSEVAFGYRAPGDPTYLGSTVNMTRKLTGVAEGLVSSTSKQAINGSQLFETNQKLADSLGGGSTVDAKTGEITGPTYNFTDNSSHTNVGSALTNLDKRVDSNTTNIQNLDDRVTINEGNISQNTTDITNIKNGEAGLVKLVDDTIVIDNVLAAKADTFNIAQADGSVRQLTGVKDAELSATSKDAVNGSQLFATNEQVAENTTNIATNTTDIQNLDDRVTINEGSISKIEGDVVSIGDRVTVNEGNITKIDDRVTINEGNITQNTTDIKNIGDRVTVNEGNITQNTTDIKNIKTGEAGLVKLVDDTIVIDNVLAAKAETFNIAQADGSVRQLTGVKDAELSATSKDAVNGSQLFATNEQVAENTTNIATNTTDIKNIQGDVTSIGDRVTVNEGNITQNTTDIKNIKTGEAGLVKLVDDTIVIDNVLAAKADTFNIAQADGSVRQLTGVKDAELSATSKDAVNGSQLFATNEQVAENTTNIATNTTDIKNIDDRVTINEGSISKIEGDVVSIGDRVTVNEGNITKIDDRVTINEGNITQNTTDIKNIKTGEAGLVKLVDDTIVIDNVLATKAETFNIAQADGSVRQLTGVKDAELSATSKDAVNGSQLFATNEQVAENTTNIATNTTDIKNIDDRVTINEGSISKIEGDVVSIGDRVTVNEGNITKIDDRVTINEGTISQNTTDIKNIGDRVTINEGNITQNTTDIKNIKTGEAGLVKLGAGNKIVIDNDLAKDATIFDLAQADGSVRQLTGVKDAELSATSKDAVNGSQLFATNEQVAENTTNIATNTTDIKNIDGRVTVNEGNIKNIGDRVTVNEGNIKTIGDRVTVNEGDIKTIQGDITNITSGKSGLVQLADNGEVVLNNEMAGVDGATFNLANKDGSARQLTGVKDAELSATSKDAVNGSQLFATNEQVAENTTNIATNTTDIKNIDDRVTINEGSISKIEGDVVSIGDRVTVNEGNITKIDDRVTINEGNITQNTTDIKNIKTGEAGLVKLVDDTIVIDNVLAAKADTFNIAQADGSERQLTGVKDAELSATSKDAVNGSQLFATNEQVAENTTNIATNTTDIKNIDGRVTVNEGNIKNIGDRVTVNEGNIKTIGDRVTVNEGDIKTIQGDITNITSGKSGLVQLADNGEVVLNNEMAGVDGATFNLANKDGSARQLTGVKDAELSATSKDAVNGSQLFATNEQVAENTTNIATNTTDIKNIDDRVTINEGSISKIEGDIKNIHGDITTIGENITKQGDQITTITTTQGNSLKGIEDAFGGEAKFDADGNLTMPNYKDALAADKDLRSVEEGFRYVNGKLTGIAAGTAGLIKVSADGKSLVVDNALAKNAVSFDISNEGSSRTLTGVSDGKLAVNSTDAVNGSQLFATNEKVNENTTNIATNTTDIKNIDDRVTINEGSISKIEGDMVSIGDRVTVNEGNISKIDDRVTINEGNITQNTTDIKTIGDRVTVNEGNIKNIQGDITTIGENITKQGDQITTITTTQGNSLKGIEDAFGGEAKFDADGNLTMPNYKDALAADKDLRSVEEGFRYVGGELKDQGDQITNIDQRVTVNEGDISDIKGDITNITSGKSGLVQLADNGEVVLNNEMAGVDGATFNLANKDGSVRKLTGIEEAELNDSSNDAVSGKQLHATNQKVAENSANITNLDKRVTVNEGNITTIQGDITDIQGDITNITAGKSGLVQLREGTDSVGNKVQVFGLDNEKGKDATVFDFANADGTTRTLKGISEGAIKADSTEAISGGQMYEIGSALVKHLDPEAKLNSRGVFEGLNYQEALGTKDSRTSVSAAFEAIRDGKAGVLQLSEDGTKLVFSDVAKEATSIDFTGEEGAMTLTGVADGKVAKDSLDAINGSQLYATNKSVSDALGGGSTIDGNGNITKPTYVINGDTYHNVGDAITNIDGRVIDNTKNITELTNNITSGKAGLVMVEGNKIVFDSSIAGGRTFDISNKGDARTLTGVENGTIASGSKDAVNGGQLFDTNQKVADNTNNIGKVTDALGGGAGIDKDGNVKGPNYSFNDGSNHTTVGSALDNLDGRVTDLDKKVDGITNGTEGLVKLEKDANGHEKLVIDNGLAGKADTFDISNGDKDRTLTGVAEGKVESGSKDAINGSQLHDSNQSIADIFGGGATIDKDGYVSMPEYDFGNDNKFNNVGDSLAYLNNKVQSGAGGLFQMSADGKTVVLGDVAKSATTVDMGNRVIAGVANGKIEQGSLEAVNGGQLWETNQNVTANTNQIKHINNTLNHYNTRINNLEKTVHENRKRASAGTASAMAMSSIPYLDYAKYSFGMGVASYDGEAAMSMGLEFKMGDNGRFRIQGSYDTQNKAGVGVGMAFEL